MRAALISVCWLSVAAALMLALLPWGGGDAVRLAQLLLPLVAMLAWAALRPAAMGLLLPFLCGLVVDVAAQGPLGLWSVGYVLAVGAGQMALAGLHDRGTYGARWLRIALSVGGGAMAVWLAASLYHFDWQVWQPFAYGALIAAASAPLVMLVIYPLTRLGAGQRRLQLERRGQN